MKDNAKRAFSLAGFIGAAIVGATSPGWAQPPLLELRTVSESVPPGGVMQAKVEVTEPRPISTGGGSFDFGGFGFLGIAANSADGDAAAAAVVRGSTARVRMVSPSGGLGLAPDYPILTMTMHVPATTPPGTRVPLTLADGAVFLDSIGTPYPYTFRAGELTVAGELSIANVSPGSAVVPVGGVVTIDGLGFDADTEVRISETALAETRLVGSTRLEVVLAQAATMHGREVEVRDSNTNERTSYFAYQRTTPLGTSGHPLFQAVEPAFAQRFFTSTWIRFEAETATSAFGLAVQNIGQGTVSAVLELVAAAGTRLGQTSVTLGVNTRAVRSLTEVFGTSCTGPCAVRVSSSAPLQVMGLAGDIAQDAVMPVLPIADVPMALTTALNAQSYAIGETLVLSASFTPGVLPVRSDVYVVLQTPGGQMLSLTPGGLVPGLSPLARDVMPGAPLTQELLRIAVPAGTLPGGYQWMSAMASPGTLTLTTPITVTPFTIVP